jgi:hypothetical protein
MFPLKTQTSNSLVGWCINLDGTIVHSGVKFRNEFHLNPLSSADLFVPCGGRPESVDLTNVAKLFKEDGTVYLQELIF